MERISSFTVDHTTLIPGLYLSRKDGDIITYDLRFCKPNTTPLLDMVELHSVEHLLATFLRNSPLGDHVVYFGPMGCQTGFYLLFQGVSHQAAIASLQQAINDILAYDGPMPGASAKECGNYRSLDMAKGKAALAKYAEVIKDWTPEKLVYE